MPVAVCQKSNRTARCEAAAQHPDANEDKNGPRHGKPADENPRRFVFKYGVVGIFGIAANRPPAADSVSVRLFHCM